MVFVSPDLSGELVLAFDLQNDLPADRLGRLDDVARLQRQQVVHRPLGGLGDIGRNTMVYETADDLVVVDAGIMFPTEEMHGIDFIIADVSYIAERRHKLRAYLITHGHEDHIGALPHILRDLPAPIYASRLANGLIENKLNERKIKDIDQVTVDDDTVLDLEDNSQRA